MSVTSNDKQHQSAEPRVWVVRTGRKGSRTDSEGSNLSDCVVSIGWGDWGAKLNEFSDRKRFGEHLSEAFAENYTQSGRDNIWRFGKIIEIDDIVVMPLKSVPDIAIGRVEGSYEYDPSQSEKAKMRRSVRWLTKALPKSRLRPDLRKSVDRRGAVYKVGVDDASYRIQYLAEHGADPGPRESTDDNQTDIWKQRLEQYLDARAWADDTTRSVRGDVGRWIDYALAHDHNPSAFDQPLLEALLDSRNNIADGTRQKYARRVEGWCKWAVDEPWVGSGTDAPSRQQQRLDNVARDLFWDINHLQEIVDLLEDKRQVIFYGPPGTGKTYLAQELAKALAPDEGARRLVQFHPAYSYEDFFEGYRPKVDEDKQMTYELTEGPLAKLAKHATEHKDQQHIMVIDEINRANLPRVFGELLFLLEYRDKSIQVMYRPDQDFSLPENLWFIGTMNTADRSIALFDAAMRRRFHFVPFFPEREPIKDLLRKWTEKNAPEQQWVVNLVSEVNRTLATELGGDHLQLGPSHFMREDLNDGGFERVWRYNIEPFIEDQLFGQPDKTKDFRYESVMRRDGPPESNSEGEGEATEIGDDTTHDD